MYANQKQHENALQEFNQILKDHKFDTLALLGKANSLVFLGDLEKAEKIYKEILNQSPENRHAIAELAGINLQRGNDKEAERLYHKAISVGGDQFICPYEGLGMLYLKTGRTEKAKKFFKKAININSDIEYKKFNGLAKIYIREGKLRKAEKLLRKSKENYPYDDEAEQLLEKIRTEHDDQD